MKACAFWSGWIPVFAGMTGAQKLVIFSGQRVHGNVMELPTHQIISLEMGFLRKTHAQAKAFGGGIIRLELGFDFQHIELIKSGADGAHGRLRNNRVATQGRVGNPMDEGMAAGE